MHSNEPRLDPFVPHLVSRCTHSAHEIGAECTQLATFTQLGSGNWRVQVRRKTRYVAETFRRRKDGEECALEMERNIDRNGSSKPRVVRNVRTFGDLIDLHDEDMREVGKPPRRSKSAVMASQDRARPREASGAQSRAADRVRKTARQTGRWSRDVGDRYVFHPHNHNARRRRARHRGFSRGSQPRTRRVKSPQFGWKEQRA